MYCPTLRRSLSKWRTTPFHPQWQSFRRARGLLERIGAEAEGVVLDVGCADRKPADVLPAGARYVGLDYYQTATQWYGTRPDVYGDAERLPIADRSVDCVLLLDVLEHLRAPATALGEMHRVLKPGGKMIVQVPFLYPIHDAPLDFSRWTVHGLRALVESGEFRVVEETAIGKPIETAALLANIAMSRTALSWIERRSPAAIFALFLPVLVLTLNCLSWLFARVSPDDGLMPSAYRVCCRKL